MERIRSPRPDQDSSLETIGPLPASSSLLELLEVVRSPGVVHADVDALLQGLARPLAEDESPRARADFLLFLIEAPDVHGMQGSDGRTVRAAAVQALLELGYPYALELPPEALPDASRPKGGAQEIPIVGLIATLAGVLAQLGYAIPSVLKLPESERPGSLVSIVILLGMVLGPAASSVLGGWQRMRGLQQLGLIFMALTGGLWLVGFAISLVFTSQPLLQSDTWLALVAGLGFVLGAALTRHPEWLAPDNTSGKDTPPPPRP